APPTPALPVTPPVVEVLEGVPVVETVAVLPDPARPDVVVPTAPPPDALVTVLDALPIVPVAASPSVLVPFTPSVPFPLAVFAASPTPAPSEGDASPEQPAMAIAQNATIVTAAISRSNERASRPETIVSAS